MGQGGYIKLCNHTTHKWVLLQDGKYQMNAWYRPDSVDSGSEVSFYFEWNQSIFINPCDDSAFATYRLEGTSIQFTVRAQASGGYTRYYFDTYVDLQTLSLLDMPGSRYHTGWNHNGTVYFIVYEDDGCYFGYPKIVEDFFAASYEMLKDKPLNQISLVGSHDAGMYEMNGGTAGATRHNTLTQTHSIYQQLMRGARFFDIRPVIGNGGQLLAGHYSAMMRISLWEGRLGGNGAALETIVSDINRFTRDHVRELVIIDLSHAYNTDSGYHDLNAAEWERVFTVLQNLNCLIRKSAVKQAGWSLTNLGALTLENLLSLGRVLLRLDDDPPGDLPDYIFSRDCLNICGEYSDTNAANTMIDDQLDKMARKKTKDNMFQLYWTLTQSGCGLLMGDICFSAVRVNKLLMSRLLEQVSSSCYPNIIYVDNICTERPALAAQCVNQIKHNKMSFDRASHEEKTPVLATSTTKGRYICAVQLFAAGSLSEARLKCPTGFKLLEDMICRNLVNEMVFLCYQRTDDASAALRTLDGSNGSEAQKKIRPIVDVGIAEDGVCRPGWEHFANVRAFLPQHSHDCYIVVKRE